MTPRLLLTMTGQLDQAHAEIVDLATRLRTLNWSWRLADAPALAAAFDWKVLMTLPNSAMLDTGLGMASGSVIGQDGAADVIEIRVTDFTEDDGAGRAQIRDTFARMATALTTAIGQPSRRTPGKLAELRWAGINTTLQLQGLPTAVRLTLMTNDSLARHDRAVELQEQGLI